MKSNMLEQNYGREFSKRLRALRLENNLTIEEFANMVGISKSSVGYYENQNRVPDIVVVGRIADALNVSTDYLIGRSDARTKEPKLKSICDKIGLSDKAANMLARLKKDADSRLCIINFLLEQADGDIDTDYDLDGRYNGSVLNAVIRYLEQVAYETANNTLDKAAYSVLRQLILCQVVEALWETGGQL